MLEPSETHCCASCPRSREKPGGTVAFALPGRRGRAEDLILNRARSLAWQAVRHTPGDSAGACACLAWLRRAGLWAAGRELTDLSGEISAMLERLEESLPRLRAENINKKELI